MIALVFMACLPNGASDCREQQLLFSSENLTPYMCLMQAQPELAKWTAGHPGWTIAKWGCRRVAQGEASL
ncbi:hypothetical protein [Frigidibacter sp. MR17.24]|uniref:hypothetical protein n=1 Tax=Frigidibacter sp. MR17.24 TaxID=3127345 RepID=UPI003012C727